MGNIRSYHPDGFRNNTLKMDGGGSTHLIEDRVRDDVPRGLSVRTPILETFLMMRRSYRMISGDAL